MKKNVLLVSLVVVLSLIFANFAIASNDEGYSDKASAALFGKKILDKPVNYVNFKSHQKETPKAEAAPVAAPAPEAPVTPAVAPAPEAPVAPAAPACDKCTGDPSKCTKEIKCDKCKAACDAKMCPDCTKECKCDKCKAKETKKVKKHKRSKKRAKKAAAPAAETKTEQPKAEEVKK